MKMKFFLTTMLATLLAWPYASVLSAQETLPSRETVMSTADSTETPSSKMLQVWQVDLTSDVNAASWLQISRGFDQAEASEADLILLHMNTYGGEVSYADSIRTRILNTKAPVCVFIDPNAASAGALISVACDRIYMRSGATIGASTVVNQSGAAAPDKYQSYMRAMIRATAETTGRNPQIAEAFVDPDVVVPGLVDTGKVLTLTASEAQKYGFCDAIVESVDELIAAELDGQPYTHRQFTLSSKDKVKGGLMNSALRGLLIMIIVAGIWFELQSPGIGFPSIAAFVAALLYFAPLFMDGMVAYWEIIVFVVGVLLLFVEILVIPGFGVTGILGIICMVAGLSFALVDEVHFSLKGMSMGDFDEALLLVIVSMILATLVCLWLTSKIGTGKGTFSKMALLSTQKDEEGYVGVPSELKELIGQTGQTASILRPSGKIVIDGTLYDAVAQFGYIEDGRPVKVVRCEAGQLYVEEIN